MNEIDPISCAINAWLRLKRISNYLWDFGGSDFLDEIIAIEQSIVDICTIQKWLQDVDEDIPF